MSDSIFTILADIEDMATADAELSGEWSKEVANSRCTEYSDLVLRLLEKLRDQ